MSIQIEIFCCVHIISQYLNFIKQKMSFYIYSLSSFPFISNLDYYSSFSYQLPSFQTTFQQSQEYVIPSHFYTQGQLCNNNDMNKFDDGLKLNQKLLNTEYVVEMPKNEKIIQKKRAKNQISKEISSAKKNSQSNIVNQFYSFFSCREKSQKIVIKAIQSTVQQNQNKQKIINLFYTTIRQINRKRGRKYVNRDMLKNYFTPEDIQINLPEFKKQMDNVDYITLEQLCQIFRRCSQAFLKMVSVPAILTSKRITGISKQEHFKKRRKILKALTQF